MKSMLMLPFAIFVSGCWRSSPPKEDYGITITSHVCEEDGGGCRKETRTFPPKETP